MTPVPGFVSGRSKQWPTRSLGESLMMARHSFWIWRRSRPFWGGLLVMTGASEMLLSEQDLLSVVPHIGIQGLAGYLIPAHLLLMGVLLWLNPAERTIYSLIAIFLALWSWTTSNLGGFFVGMLLGMVGGALAFAWTTDAQHGSPSRRVRGKQRILSSSAGIAHVGVHLLDVLRHVSGMVADVAVVLRPGQHSRDSDREHEGQQEAAPAPLPREPGGVRGALTGSYDQDHVLPPPC